MVLLSFHFIDEETEDESNLPKKAADPCSCPVARATEVSQDPQRESFLTQLPGSLTSFEIMRQQRERKALGKESKVQGPLWPSATPH